MSNIFVFIFTPEKWTLKLLSPQLKRTWQMFAIIRLRLQSVQNSENRSGRSTSVPTDLCTNPFPTWTRTRAITKKATFFWQAICYNYASCHTSNFTSMGERQTAGRESKLHGKGQNTRKQRPEMKIKYSEKCSDTGWCKNSIETALNLWVLTGSINNWVIQYTHDQTPDSFSLP